MVNVFLYAPQNFHNICLLSRSLEYFGLTDCHVFDPHRLVRDRYGKYRRRQLRDLSRGTFEMIRWNRIEAPKEFFANPPGRLVATVAGTHAESVTSFKFSPSDIILFGSESCGLPAEVVSASAASITIPAYGRTQSLNLAVAVSVVLYEYRRHLGETSDS
jgi:tRNA(Leu) C34 or U34 (ribose-2'-O)-methylase TrmL